MLLIQSFSIDGGGCISLNFPMYILKSVLQQYMLGESVGIVMLEKSALVRELVIEQVGNDDKAV